MKLTSIKDSLTSMFKKPVVRPEHDWKMSKRSLTRMEGVNDDLVRVAHLALKYSKLDFGITSGLRTKEQQARLVREGKSQTMKSRHIDGMALDIVVYKDGKVSWDIEDYVVVAQAWAWAARDLGVTIRWGGAWTTTLNQTDAKEAHESYLAIRKEQKRRAFIDGPHFEIPKE